MDHHYLEGVGQTGHDEIDRRLPTETEKGILAELVGAPISVTGMRNDLEGALANLLAALESLGQKRSKTCGKAVGRPSAIGVSNPWFALPGGSDSRTKLAQQAIESKGETTDADQPRPQCPRR